MPEFIPLNLSPSKFRSLRGKEQDDRTREFYDRNQQYFSELLRRYSAGCIVILANSGTVHSHGPGFETAPTGLEIYEIVKKSGEPVFIYCPGDSIAQVCTD